MKPAVAATSHESILLKWCGIIGDANGKFGTIKFEPRAMDRSLEEGFPIGETRDCVEVGEWQLDEEFNTLLRESVRVGEDDADRRPF